MLSINIPVYNIEVYSLVFQLVKKTEHLNVQVEINVFDDGSEKSVKEQNRKIKVFKGVNYVELKNNLGRAKIRNKMGLESKFDYLLFIDADSAVINENYLRFFFENIAPNRVLCGGTIYKNSKPVEPEKLLRWHYGKTREAISADERNDKKGFIITSNNFLIEKRVFEKIHFREELKKYGHEDTLLGFDLYENNIEILHIENAVEHTGLESGEEFLTKTRAALDSLYYISNQLLAENPEFKKQVYFLNRYSKITSFFPVVFLKVIYKTLNGFLKQNLLGKHPKLFLFDLYKLLYYSTVKNREQ